MQHLTGRRDLLRLGAVTTISGVLSPLGRTPAAQTPERTGRAPGTAGLSVNRTLEALKEAGRWPSPALPLILTLTGQYLAAGRDEEAFGYFRERAAAAPDQPILMALEGMFQLRMAGQVFLLRRVAWVKDGIAKLDRAAESGHPVTRYLRAVTLAELPARFGRAEAAVAELEWVLRQQDTFPPGLRRGVYRGLARALTTLERTDEAQAALARSGYPSLDPALPQFTADFSVTARDARESLTVGGTEFVLYPVHGGETADALLIHLPASDVLFVGDAFMPYLGAPFLPEGSAEGLFETIALIRSLNPRTLIHGHPPLTELFTAEALPSFEAALREVHERTLEGIGAGRTLAEMLEDNWLPGSLRAHPNAVLPFLVIRDNFVQRVVHQRTGCWKADGEGIEVVAPREWAGVLNLLAGGQEGAFVRSARVLLEHGDEILALKLVDLGLLSHPASRALPELRRHALDRLRTRYQGLNPFKFIVYSEWAGVDLPRVA